jgi:hypothetical protein
MSDDNVILDGILVVPAKQQYGEYFSFVERTKVHRDVKKDISDNYLLINQDVGEDTWHQRYFETEKG